MKFSKKLLTMLLVLAMVFSLCIPALADNDKITIGGLENNTWMTKYGNVNTDCTAEKFSEMGFEWGDLVKVSFLDQELVLPVVPTYSYVDSGKPAIILGKGADGSPDGYVSLAINMGNFAETYQLAQKHKNDDGSWYWTAWEGVSFPVELKFVMAEEDGYRAEYILHDLQRTNVRTDYLSLTDAEFANFRNIGTTGMGENILFRGSSPINPELGRNTYADAALKNAGVTVIMNLADSAVSAGAYPGYGDSYYHEQNVIFLNLGVDFQAEEFKTGLAHGLRYFAEHEGVYYVHCTEGKDRAGFVSALLECFMGASYDEVVADYMVTYKNYYGVEPGTDKYEAIAASNIIKSLEKAFGVEDLKTADLKAEAEEYIKEIGLSDDEIAALRANLGRSGEAFAPFSDISDSGYREYILGAYDFGIVNGCADGTFRPNAGVTRAQFITMLYRMSGASAPEKAALEFSDADSIAEPYLDAVNWGVQNGIIKGFADDTFRPDQLISRAQMATFMARFIQMSGIYDEAKMSELVKPYDFADSSDIAAPYAESVNIIANLKIMNGVGNDLFAPDGTATRGMAATVLLRAYQTLFIK